MTPAPRPPRNPALDWTEDQLQANTLALAAALGWNAYHTHDSRRSQPGFPDLVLWHPARGRVIFRELKRQSGRVSPEQANTLRTLTEAGADAAVWRCSDWVDRTVEKDLRGIA